MRTSNGATPRKPASFAIVLDGKRMRKEWLSYSVVLMLFNCAACHTSAKEEVRAGRGGRMHGISSRSAASFLPPTL